MRDPRDIFRRFSTQAKKILTTSQQVAESGETGISSEHMLIALAITPETVAFELLKEYAVTLEQIRLVLSLMDTRAKGLATLTGDAKAILKVALKGAARLQHKQIEPEHLLLAISTVRESRAYQLIARVGVDPEHIRRQLETLLGSSSDLRMVIQPTLTTDTTISDPDERIELGEHDHDHHHVHSDDAIFLNPDGDDSRGQRTKKAKMLDLFTIDLTDLARRGKLDPVIGRAPEIARTIHILARRTKNNPVLIGEPGVGKTAIVEGLAQMVASNRVPRILQGRRILRLDLGLLVAGTMYRGQFEERLKKLLEEIAKDTGTIMFIDEIHTMVGTGSAEGSMDAANMLKPALARGELRLIGATTLDDYRRFIEKDPALERRFQTIVVHEPSADEAVTILEGLRPAYEEHHHVRIAHDAIVAAVTYAKRYIMDRQLPDKAIDLLDEAAAAKQISQPNKASEEAVRLGSRIDQLVKQKERAIEREAFAQAASLREKELHFREKLGKLEVDATKTQHHPLVTREDIATIVAQLTGVPRNHLLRDRSISAGQLEERLNTKLIGQTEAVATVTAAIRRAQARLTQANKPLGSFLLLGPSGVGKTELARLLAREVFGRTDAFIKLDMSEFMERHTVARLVGAPPGYVGYEDAGKLTEAVRRRPYTLLLLDEIEKAHPEVHNLLLQILEDGVLTDAKGRRVSFANTIIVMTSNLGAGQLTKAQALGFQTHNHTSAQEAIEHYSELSDRVMTSVRDYFPPEFLNRLDGVIIFRPLDKQTIAKIVDLRVDELITQIASEDYQLLVTASARQVIAEHGFDADYGARPIRRLLTQWIENPLASLILDNQVPTGATVKVVPAKVKDTVLLKVEPVKG